MSIILIITRITIIIMMMMMMMKMMNTILKQHFSDRWLPTVEAYCYLVLVASIF